MTTSAQKKALVAHRRRSAEQGLVRVEVRVPQESAQLIRELATELREDISVGARIEHAFKSVERAQSSTWAEILAELPDVSGPEYDAAFERPRMRIEFRDKGL